MPMPIVCAIINPHVLNVLIATILRTMYVCRFPKNVYPMILLLEPVFLAFQAIKLAQDCAN